VSVRSLLDRFQIDSKQSSYLGKNAVDIFEVLKPLHELEDKYKTLLVIASKLHSIGTTLNFYKSNDNTFDFILNGLNYDFQHCSRVTVAHMIKFSKKSLPSQSDLDKYAELLPELETMEWLSFMISLNLMINQDMSNPKVIYKLKENKLKICLDKSIYIVESEIDKGTTFKIILKKNI
jgi:exopolyphosphatase/guanosine-5'-triphosphate,3'-diphosphate pyrophosphatase